ncbi:glutathione S-transferase [Aureococcus anophagefferens]|uniref:Glutathione S-transferase n=1 Tax=Aureococcus anophagefferens TaxID=44056 RepID=A0ABR1FRD6_AURAN|nr:glutathione transferase [Aureococcus anophagefferens]
MAIHELLYFPVTALGEPIRLALAVGGVDFKNTTTRNDDTFHERKKSLSPLGEAGQVPILVLPDGKALCQSRAIRGGRLRYLGKVCEFEGTPLYPTDPLAAYEADALIDLADDMRSPVASTFGIADQAEKEAARAALWAEGGKQAKWAAALDATLAKDPMATLTIGNLYAFCMVNMFRTPTFLDGVPPGVFDQYANIAKHHDWIANLAPVKAYYADKEEREAFKPLAAEPAAKKAKTDA